MRTVNLHYEYFFLQLIAKNVTGPFHVVGHSIGGSVAFEMALQSERADKNLKTITLMNGSKDLTNSLNKEDVDNTDPEISALCNFVSQFVESKGTTRVSRIHFVFVFVLIFFGLLLTIYDSPF